MSALKKLLLKKAFETGIIAPSILSADFSKLGEELKSVEKEGCKWIHVDVMDGHFVPNLTIGPVVVESLRKTTKSILDCHLMVTHPEKWIDAFAKAGADGITIHAEATEDLPAIIQKIKKYGVIAGVSINPDTPVEKIISILDQVDLVLIMSVHPGFGGQKFIESSIHKIEQLLTYKKNNSFVIQVDGGIYHENIGRVRGAGADILVAGSAVFKDKNRKKSIRKLTEALESEN